MNQLNLWLGGAAAVLAGGAWFTWFLSTRPILFTRLFVSQEERMVVRREIMEGGRFRRRMRRISLVQLLASLACVGVVFAFRR